MNKITIILIILIAVGALVFLTSLPDKPGQYDELARSIADSGAKFYGAFWCPHCQEQKAQFGKSAQLLPYVECSTPDTKGQLPICAEKEIKTYPTWIFKDGTRHTGVLKRDEFVKFINDTVATSTPEFIQ